VSTLSSTKDQLVSWFNGKTWTTNVYGCLFRVQSDSHERRIPGV